MADGGRSEAPDRSGGTSGAALNPVVYVIAGLAHAVLMWLAYPPVGFWPAAVLAIVPLAWAAVRISERLSRLEPADEADRRLSRRRRLARSVYPALLIAVGVFPFYIYQLHWLIPVTAVGYVPMAIGMSLFPAGFAWFIAEARLRLPQLPLTLTAPIIWTGLEVFRGEVAFSGYPWFLIAHPLIDAPLLPMPAAVFGTYSITFIVAMLAGAAADALMLAKPRRPAAVAGVAGAAIVVVASLLAPGAREVPDGPPLRIAIVQTNLPQDNKISWTIEQKILDLERFLELTHKAATSDPRPDLIVWPETMFPDLLDPQAVAEQRTRGLVYHVDPAVHPSGRLFATEFHDWLIQVQHRLDVPMLVGGVGVDNLRIGADEENRVLTESDGYYNSVFLLEGGRVIPERYDKLRLTPFGEFMPYLNQWPWLERQLMALGARGMRFDLSAGREPRAFKVRDSHGRMVAIATPICFEVTAPRLNHQLLRTIDSGRPRILINITNDGWFSSFDGAREQHLQISRWRALESGVPMVRAANTGISAWIDARGRLIKAGTDDGRVSRADGILTAEVRPTTGGTIYSRTGDLFAWVSLAAAGGLILVSLFCPRTAG